MAALKLFGVTIPEAYGGAGLDTLSLVMIIEEIARVDGALALTIASHNSLCSTHLFQYGNEAQREKYLPALTSGETLGAWALTEAASGSDAAAMETRAEYVDKHWNLNGGKIFITQGSVAGLYVVMAKTDHNLGKNGISAFVVEKGTHGLIIGKPEKKLGVRASDTAAIHFENLRLLKENLLGERHQGYQQALQILSGGRIGIGAMAVGLAQGALDRALKYAGRREQFGQKLGVFQGIQQKLADMSTEIQAARLVVYQAANLKDTQKPYASLASQAKLFASEAASRTTAQAVQILGGTGFMKEAEVERFFRDAKLCEIGEGTSEIQRIIIAKNLLQ